MDPHEEKAELPLPLSFTLVQVFVVADGRR
jgi:hypothetical protein